MEKKLLLLLGLALCVLLPTKAQIIYFSDGFEEGLSAAWTQEYFDAAKKAWVTETSNICQPWKTERTNLQYPQGAVIGNGRAYFRQEAKEGSHVQTTGYRTRLITPKMDLSVGYQPILRFYHAQCKWTADFDTLRVYYRAGTGTQWRLLSEYTTNIQKWTFEEIDLPAVGADYQIAFEANENIGRGIVLDSVLVRTKPQITVPHDITTYDIRDNGANVTWTASKDADYFRFILSSRDLDLNVTPNMLDSTDYILLDSTVTSDIEDIRVNNLEPSTTYYVQIQSLGETENSVWSTTAKFRIKSIAYIPYTANFNMKFKSNELSDQRDKTWTWGSGVGVGINDTYAPIIPLWIGSEYFDRYSPDATAPVAFVWNKIDNSGSFARSQSTMIPGGQTAYIVSPELSAKDVANFSLSMCHVTFWGTVYDKTANAAKSITVGVMTDPEDPTTFEAVETCTVWGYKTFEYFDVNLASYQGTGRYVAFMSSYDKENQFFLDNVTIAMQPEVYGVNRNNVHIIPQDTFADLNWQAVQGAQSYKIKYMKMEKKGAIIPVFADAMNGALTVTATQPNIRLSELESRAKYAFSIQVVGSNGTSEWSRPGEFYTNSPMSIPHLFGFEEEEGVYYEGDVASKLLARDWMLYSNDTVKPYCYAGSARTGARSLYMGKNIGTDVWAVAPMIDNLSDIEMKFYIAAPNASFGTSTIRVGVMTEPGDLSTFVQLNEFTTNGAIYKKCFVSFDSYKGNGKYVALVWGDKTDNQSAAVCVDDVIFQPYGNCIAPEVIADDVLDTKALIHWTRRLDTERYNVKVFTSRRTDDELEVATSDLLELHSANQVNLELTNLDYMREYYIYVQTVCDIDAKSDWSELIIKTTCPQSMTLPFSEGFEKCETGVGNHPTCWTVPDWTNINPKGNDYPNGSTSQHHTGEKSLYMTSAVDYGSMIALPKLDADLSDIKLSFWAYAGTANYKIFVGYTSNPSDMDAYVFTDTFQLPAKSLWMKHEVTFNVTGRDKYIVMSTFTGASNSVYVDDIEIISLTDGMPFNFRKISSDDQSIHMTWDGKTTGQWQVVMSKTNYGLTKTVSSAEGDVTVDLDPWTDIKEDDIVVKKQTTQNELMASGLEQMRWYYFYIKSSVGMEWGLDSLQTDCKSLNPKEKIIEGFESYGPTCTATLKDDDAYITAPNWWKKALVPACWTVGNAQGCNPDDAATATIRSYYPYVMSNGNITLSGGKIVTTNYYDKGTAVAGKTYGYSPTGSNCLYMYGYYNASNNYAPAYAAMSKMDCTDDEMKSLIITGSYRKASTAGYALLVGVMDDPTDLSTFTVVDSLTEGNGVTGSSAVVHFEVSLEDYQGSGRYIAFRTSCNKTVKVYLDDICVNMASCPAPKPYVSNLTDVSAVLSSGLRVDNPWKYIITDTPFQTEQLDNGVMPTTGVIVPPTMVGTFDDEAPKRVQISNLLPDKTYYAYLTTLCEGNTISAWKELIFTTLCEDVDLSTWTYNFNDLPAESGVVPPCWITGNLAPGAINTYIPYPLVCAKLGTNALRLWSNKTTSKNYSGAYAVTPGLKVPDGTRWSDYQLEFDAFGATTATATSRSESDGYAYFVEIGTVDNPHDMSTLQIMDTISLPLNVRHIVVPLANYEGKGKFLVFMNEVPNDVADGSTYAWINNICFRPIPSCAAPENVRVTHAAGDSVRISWDSKAPRHHAILATKKLAPASIDDILANADSVAEYGIVSRYVTTKKALFTRLLYNQGYYAYVRAICTENDSSAWSGDECAFHTDCADMESIPFVCDFDHNTEYGSARNADCWMGAYYHNDEYYTSQTYPQAKTGVGYGASNGALYLYSYTQNSVSYKCYDVVPLLDADLNNLVINFMAKRTASTASYGTYLKVGYVTTDNRTEVAENFHLLETLTVSSTDYTDYTIDLSAKHANIPAGARIALCADWTAQGLTGSTLYASFYIDNFSIRVPSACITPKDAKIQNVGFVAATVSFIPGAEEDNRWDIEVKNTATGAVTVYDANAATYELTGLEPSSSYSLRVRTNCGNEYSDWGYPVEFRTLSVIDTYKWTFTKDEQGSVSVPVKPGVDVNTFALHPYLSYDCKDTTLNYAAGTAYLPYQVANSNTMSVSYDSPEALEARALRFYTSAVFDSAILILPYINAPRQKMLSFDVRGGYMVSPLSSTVANRYTVSTYAYPYMELSVGTVDSTMGIETFRPLMTVKPGELLKNDTLRPASCYGWDHVIISLRDIDLQGKQLAMGVMGCGVGTMFIDNVAIEQDTLNGFITPHITSAEVLDESVILNWRGNSPEYNVYVVDVTRMPKAPSFMPYLQDAPAEAVIKYEHITGTSYQVNGLTPGQKYEFYVQDAAHAGMLGSLSNRMITSTVCAALNGVNYSCGFEPGPNTSIGTNPSTSTLDGCYFQWPTSTTKGDTAYLMPDCWNYGIAMTGYDRTSTTYKKTNASMISNTNTYRYSLSGRYALQLKGTDDNKEVYAVMPLFKNVDLSELEVQFYGRCTYEYSENHATADLRGRLYTDKYLKGTKYSTKVAVGTMTNPNDPATFVPLDTVDYDYTTEDFSTGTTGTIATNDPNGIRFFQRYNVPLNGAQGRFIAFKQVDYGYFYIDDVKLQPHQTARRPRNLTVRNVKTTTADVSWEGREKEGLYVLELSTSKASWLDVHRDTVTGTSFHYTGLMVNKGYAVRVKQIGTAYGASDYAHYVTFQTECEMLNPNGYRTGFENDPETDPAYVIPGASETDGADLMQNQCWSYLNFGTAQAVNTTNFPYNIRNTDKVGYSHSGSAALKLSAYSTTYQTGVVSPAINAEVGTPGLGFDTLQLSFWACPAPHGLGSSSNAGKISTASGTTYAKYIEIGTCTDPSDPATYTVLRGWTYEVDGNNLKTGTKADATNDYAFRKVIVKLTNATGPYIFIRANKVRPDKSFTYSTMYIDDLQLERLTNCESATDLKADNITVNAVDLSWNGEGTIYDVQLSSDATFTDSALMVVDTMNVEGKHLHVDGLALSTTYYFRVRNICDDTREDLSAWSSNGYFHTPYVLMYNEQFTTDASLNDATGWRQMYGYADKVFSGKLTLRDTVTTAIYNSWRRVQNIAFPGSAVRCLLGYAASDQPAWPISVTYCQEAYYQKYWLVSPQIALDSDKGNIQLTFDAALTNYNTAQPITAFAHWNEGWDDQFMVVVSDDGGKTWKRENATVWNNEQSSVTTDSHYCYGIGDYRLTDMPATPTQYTVDLTKFSGKTIKVAFYAESKVQNSIYGVNIDNVHINYVVTRHANVEQCQYEDIDDVLGFTINGDTVSAGLHNLRRVVLSTEEDTKDSVFTMSANFLEAPEYNYSITVCEGTPFSYLGFNEHNAPGTYRMKLTSRVTGCDSLVNFTIRHTKAFERTIDTTMCYGGSVQVGNKVYTNAGTYVDTLQASEKFGGCDSIIHLTLRFLEEIKNVEQERICEGGAYTWHDATGMYKDTVITTAGIYMRRFEASNGCDSTVMLNMVVDKAEYVTVYDTICQGSYRMFDGKKYTQTGIYTGRTVSSTRTGCDSTTILNLSVKPAPVEYIYDTICDNQNYTFRGSRLTVPGIYRDTTTDMDGCMLITELRLTVHPTYYVSMGTKQLKEGESFDFFGDKLTATGTYTHLLTASTGCDSTVYVNIISVNDFTTVFYDTVCSNALPYLWMDSVVCTKAGTYTVHTKTVYDMDSVIVLNLHVIEPKRTTITENICEGSSFRFDGEDLRTAGTYEQVTQSTQTGCDSIITLVLNVVPASVNYVTARICEGGFYMFGGKQLTVAGVYRDTTYTEAGCMAIDELTLTVNRSQIVNKTVDICEGDFYEFNGEKLTTTCTRTDTVVSVVTGCDSIINLSLIVHAQSRVTIPASICAGDTLIAPDGSALTAAGEYTFKLQNRYQCDSVVVISLTVYESKKQELNVAICHGSTYLFDGKELSQAGTYEGTAVDANGCTNPVTLHLTVNEPLTGTQYAEFCDEYTYQGKTYYEAGTYMVTLQNADGCDSIVSLTLKKTDDVHDTLYVTLCAGEEYKDENFQVSKPGIYHSQTTTVGGCKINTVLYFANYPQELTVDTTILIHELPYTYHSIYYGSTTQPGVYTDDITVPSEHGCADVKVHHTLRVVDATAIYDVTVDEDGTEVWKVIYHDQMYIIREGRWYLLTGAMIADPRK